MTLRLITLFCTLVSVLSCTISPKQVTQVQQYEAYLLPDNNPDLKTTAAELAFWKAKHQKHPEQFPYVAKIASCYNHLFGITGDIDCLKLAETYYMQAVEMTHYTNSGYLKSLASNYISQHKFKAALALLKKAETIGDHLEGTQKMLFDVHLELGNYDLAKTYLDTFSDDSDFDYLIRVAKWSDHRGQLDVAIKYLEKARDKAEFANNKSEKQWIYTNLADFYGHHGNIEASYQHFLKALELNPNDAYAKKGIAWIVYSHEKNPKEALRIIESISKNYHDPDYYLLQAEIAEFKGDDKLKDAFLNTYKIAVDNNNYGDMYNKYNALLYAENKAESAKALKIAHREINNRPTPQSYDLLAWTYFNQGDYKDALQVVETHIDGKTFEPEVLFHAAKIYKACGALKKVNVLKKELQESTFELGPLMAQKIENI
ncbi:tetratricopeptide repeat protein [Siansivirga zeaxanthinifaciens]|nr:tetratricopeptide repeat protein [Siansivirga zeaxanthinifaciens]